MLRERTVTHTDADVGRPAWWSDAFVQAITIGQASRASWLLVAGGATGCKEERESVCFLADSCTIDNQPGARL